MTNSIKSFLSHKIILKRSSIHGIGMFATHTIEAGEIVYIKGGHILKRGSQHTQEVIGNYLPIDDFFVLGAICKEEEEDVKLYVNHSCDPNCGLRGEITFISLRRIEKDEELTCDYAMIDNEKYEFDCNCGSQSCRHGITGFDWKIATLQLKYRGNFARYLQDKIEKDW